MRNYLLFLLLGLLIVGSLATARAQVGLQLTTRLTSSPSNDLASSFQSPAPLILELGDGITNETPPRLRTLFRSTAGHSQRFLTPDKELAFFCRLELKLEQTTQVPVRFRLGSSQYVDYLEGKFEGWRYGY